MLGEPPLEILEQRGGAVGADTVRSSLGLHLNDAELDAHLDSYRVIGPQDFADGYFVWLVGPVTQGGL
jgi:hypothetical protein